MSPLSNRSFSPAGLRWSGVALLLMVGVGAATANEPSPSPSVGVEPHPLDWTLKFAKRNAEYIRENVRDYSCRLIKRERIKGKLQAHRFASVKVRCEKRVEDEVVEPLAVYVTFLAPATLKDRRVLYVAGQHDDKVLIRKGGAGALKSLRLKIDPESRTARRESNYPIGHIGFDKIVDRLIEIVEADIEHDASGTNTTVERFEGAKVNGRVCTRILVEHPTKTAGLQFHRANLYIDDELRVPVRLVVHGWPSGEDAKAPLLEEYTYVDLKINPGLAREEFSEANLER